MATKLKPGVLDGIRHTETVELEWNGEVYEVDVRPLKHTECEEIQAILARPVQLKARGSDLDKKGGMGKTPVNINSEVMAKSRYQAALRAAAMGTIDDAWTVQTINEEWPSEWVMKVGAHVQRISGIGNPEEVRSFREGSGKQDILRSGDETQDTAERSRDANATSAGSANSQLE